MIIETAIIATAAVIIASLGFADRVLDPPPPPKFRIFPYMHPAAGDACPFCGTVPYPVGKPKTERIHGVKDIPKACPDPKKCEARSESHLHATCSTCGAIFFTAINESRKAS